MIDYLGGGFKYFLFSSLLGDDSHFHSYFSNGLVQPPTSYAIQVHDVNFFFAIETAGILPSQLRRSGMNSWHNVCERPGWVVGSGFPGNVDKMDKTTGWRKQQKIQ